MLMDVESFIKIDDRNLDHECEEDKEYRKAVLGCLVCNCMKNEEYCRVALQELKDVVNQAKSRNDDLRKMLSKSNSKVRELQEEMRALEIQILELRSKFMGRNSYNAEQMKNQYLEGASLRELAKIYGCDKSTVKRRLIKMGVIIRDKSGDLNAPGRDLNAPDISNTIPATDDIVLDINLIVQNTDTAF